ncbi:MULTISPECIES: LysR substrate-binding domain-containing protein [Alphaproteobacteria]|uniref:DNA-binding transcriptional regulator, LysR family n=1 Tax=Pelagibacterium luteolum TaxID=440168 RepID=A0A1G8ADU2_9HYPH|nr:MULTISPECIES: LysR substrate-binding domain-containing protein [Alphaproteobacteria]SDH19134.1 DNA-binding transcriptional regulator, LysR family [Pelagibacterium luteolum]
MPTSLPPFDLDLLRTFVAIVDNGGFTRAAERVGRTQSTVSLQIKKLEENLKRRVFTREPGRELQLTPDGEILLTYARQILRLGDEARSRLMEPDVAGRVRLGTPEDFATVHLPEVLARFARAHPRVALEVNCDFTVNLLDGFSKGQYDLVLFKRELQSGAGGIGVWKEVLVWAGSPRLLLDRNEQLPLVLAPAPDVYRKAALGALDRAARPWRITYTSPSLAGLQAAVKAGLGVTVLPKEMVSAGLHILGGEQSLPDLPDSEIVLYRAAGTLPRAAEALAQHITSSLESSGQSIL